MSLDNFNTHLWILSNKSNLGYDMNHNMVVRATTSKEARQYAADAASDEGQKVWLNPKLSTIRKLLYEGKKGIIIIDSLSS